MGKRRTVAGLCAGYGGLEMGLPFLEPVWHAENNPDASRVLAERFGLPNHGDITAADWRRVERPDVLAAGFPCQPISAGGKRLHRSDVRYLWPDVARAVAALRPQTVFLENVRNITSIDGGSVLAEILGQLLDLGYSARWCILGACALGCSHHRHRWFLRAERDLIWTQPAVHVKVDTCGARRGSRVSEVASTGGGRGGSHAPPPPPPRDGDGKQRGEGSAEFWQRRRDAGRANGMPLGAVVSLLPTPTASERTGAGRGSGGMNLRTAVSLLPSPRASDGAKGGPAMRGRKGDLALPSAVLGETFERFASAVARQVEAYGSLPPCPVEPNRNGDNRLSPAFAEWMMTLPPGHVTKLCDRVPALQIIGNGVVPPVARAAWDLLSPS
jgi:DNA (cytosine-5)-methyltransferase 1